MSTTHGVLLECILDSPLLAWKDKANARKAPSGSPWNSNFQSIRREYKIKRHSVGRMFFPQRINRKNVKTLLAAEIKGWQSAVSACRSGQ
jgi:hypothetical protein